MEYGARQRKLSDRIVILAGIALAALYWIVESGIHAVVLGGGLLDALAPRDSNEIWMRLLFAFVLVCCSIYAQSVYDQRRREQEDLRLFSRAVEEAPDGVQIVGLEGRIVYSNRAVQEVYGFSPEEYRGKHVGEMNADPEFAGEVILPSIMETGRWAGELMVKHKDGGVFPIWLTAALVKDARGMPIAMLGIIRDLTEPKQAEEKLRSALSRLDAESQRMEELVRETIDAQERERHYLASGIHNDLLQRLAIMPYYLEMLDLSRAGEEKYRQQKDKLAEIVSSALDAGRALISEIEPIREPEIGLMRAIEKSIDATFENAGTKVDCVHPESLRELSLADKTNILRIIQEALMNVRKHSLATEAHVKVTSREDGLEVVVEDNGVGFDPAAASTRVSGHYGLLSMQQRARLVGGQLTVVSRPAGGTVVRAVFPVRHAAAVAADAEVPP